MGILRNVIILGVGFGLVPCLAQASTYTSGVDAGIIGSIGYESPLSEGYKEFYQYGSATKNFELSDSVSYNDPLRGLISASAAASADLPTGELKVYAASSPTCVKGDCTGAYAEAYARFYDTLTFSIPGADATTITPMTLTFESNGLMVGKENDAWHEFKGSIFDLATESYGLRFNASPYQEKGVGAVSGDSLASFEWHTLNRDHYDLTAVYNLRGANPVLFLTVDLYANADWGSLADFSHTARVGMAVPHGVTWESASGAFLTAPTSGVPEPMSWTMLIAGFGFVGSVQRLQARRRRCLGRNTSPP